MESECLCVVAVLLGACYEHNDKTQTPLMAKMKMKIPEI